MISKMNHLSAWTKQFSVVALSALALAGCGGGSGADVVANPVGNQSGGQPSNYNGPAPTTQDVANFKTFVWDNIIAESGCNNCHVEGQQSPSFARGDDINMAYSDANPLIDLLSPQNSRLVTKVGGGHNCWLGSSQACADIMQTWIEGWAGGNAAAGGRDIELEAPTARQPGSSKNFPADAATFQATVYPLLETYCQECHSSGSAVQQSPFIGEPPDDNGSVAVAYDAVKTKINLDDTELSRLVVRLGEEFHNCWSDCSSDAATRCRRPSKTPSPNRHSARPGQSTKTLSTSKALTLLRRNRGQLAATATRPSQVALWEFKSRFRARQPLTRRGVDAGDSTSRCRGNVEWVGGYGIHILERQGAGFDGRDSAANSTTS